MRRSTATRARISARLRDESGVALILALTIMLILTIMLVSVIGFSSAGSRNAQHSNASEEAYALAEAGANNALAVLQVNYPAKFPGPPATQCVLHQPDVIPGDIPGRADHGCGCVSVAGAIRKHAGWVEAEPDDDLLGCAQASHRRRKYLGHSCNGHRPESDRPGRAPGDAQGHLQSPDQDRGAVNRRNRDPGMGLLGAYDFTNSVNMNSPFYVNGNVNVQKHRFNPREALRQRVT